MYVPHGFPVHNHLLMACRSDKGVTAFNAKPDVSITSHNDGDVVLEGELISFRGSASDANHRPQSTTATWYVGSEVLCEATESDGAVQCDGILLPSDTEVTLEVTDAGNATSSASVSLTVTPTDAQVHHHRTRIKRITTAIGSSPLKESSPTPKTAPRTSSVIGCPASTVVSEVTVEPNTEGEVTGYGLLSEGQRH